MRNSCYSMSHCIGSSCDSTTSDEDNGSKAHGVQNKSKTRKRNRQTSPAVRKCSPSNDDDCIVLDDVTNDNDRVSVVNSQSNKPKKEGRQSREVNCLTSKDYDPLVNEGQPSSALVDDDCIVLDSDDTDSELGNVPLRNLSSSKMGIKNLIEPKASSSTSSTNANDALINGPLTSVKVETGKLCEDKSRSCEADIKQELVPCSEPGNDDCRASGTETTINDRPDQNSKSQDSPDLHLEVFSSSQESHCLRQGQNVDNRHINPEPLQLIAVGDCKPAGDDEDVGYILGGNPTSSPESLQDKAKGQEEEEKQAVKQTLKKRGRPPKKKANRKFPMIVVTLDKNLQKETSYRYKKDVKKVANLGLQASTSENNSNDSYKKAIKDRARSLVCAAKVRQRQLSNKAGGRGDTLHHCSKTRKLRRKRQQGRSEFEGDHNYSLDSFAGGDNKSEWYRKKQQFLSRIEDGCTTVNNAPSNEIEINTSHSADMKNPDKSVEKQIIEDPNELARLSLLASLSSSDSESDDCDAAKERKMAEPRSEDCSAMCKHCGQKHNREKVMPTDSIRSNEGDHSYKAKDNIVNKHRRRIRKPAHPHDEESSSSDGFPSDFFMSSSEYDEKFNSPLDSDYDEGDGHVLRNDPKRSTDLDDGDSTKAKAGSHRRRLNFEEDLSDSAKERKMRSEDCSAMCKHCGQNHSREKLVPTDSIRSNEGDHSYTAKDTKDNTVKKHRRRIRKPAHPHDEESSSDGFPSDFLSSSEHDEKLSTPLKSDYDEANEGDEQVLCSDPKLSTELDDGDATKAKAGSHRRRLNFEDDLSDFISDLDEDEYLRLPRKQHTGLPGIRRVRKKGSSKSAKSCDKESTLDELESDDGVDLVDHDSGITSMQELSSKDANELARMSLMASESGSDSSGSAESDVEVLMEMDETKDKPKEDNAEVQQDDDKPVVLYRKRPKKKKKDKLLTVSLEMPGSEAGKGNSSKRQWKKRKVVYFDNDEDDDGSIVSLNAGYSSSDESSGSDDEHHVPRGRPLGSRGRKNIRKLISNDMLEDQTKAAENAEKERRKRIAERKKLFTGVRHTVIGEFGTLKKLVLEIHPETKEELVTVHPHLLTHMKSHQADGVKFLWEVLVESLDQLKKGDGGTGCILAHSMGLGKTLQAIAFLHTVMTNQLTKQHFKTALVICPCIAVLNWADEFLKWLNTNELNTIEIYEITPVKDNYTRLMNIQNWHKNGGILVLSYDMFCLLANGERGVLQEWKESFASALLDPGPDVVICDEGHLLKNYSTKTNRTVTKIRSSRRVILTGTPLQNNLMEYHAMIEFVRPRLLGSRSEFQNRFVNPIMNGQHADSTPDDVKLMKYRTHVLQKLLKGCVQRFDFSILKPYLPPKHEYVLNVQLSKEQEEMYTRFLGSLAADNSVGQQTVLLNRNVFKDYAVLRGIWTHPCLPFQRKSAQGQLVNVLSSKGSLSEDRMLSDVENETEKMEEENGIEKLPDMTAVPGNSDDGLSEAYRNDTRIEVSGKMVLLFSILQVCKSIGDKVLLFSQSLDTLNLIEKIMANMTEQTENLNVVQNPDPCDNNKWILGEDYFRMDGSTPAEVRQNLIEAFNDPKNRAWVFLISTKAGSLATNLHGANRVILLDVSWNPADDVQAIFRSFRLGQTKPVYVYRLLSQGTMEEKIYERQVNKESLSFRVLDELQTERHFTASDLQKLYEYDPLPPSERKTLPVPKDALLAEVLSREGVRDWIVSYHEHDSLFQNIEEDLTEEEKKAALMEYEYNNRVLREKNNKASNGQGGFLLNPFVLNQPQRFAGNALRLRFQHPFVNNCGAMGQTQMFFTPRPSSSMQVVQNMSYAPPSEPTTVRFPFDNNIHHDPHFSYFRPPAALRQSLVTRGNCIRTAILQLARNRFQTS